MHDFGLGKISLETFMRWPQLDDQLDVTIDDEQVLEALEMLQQIERIVRGSERSPRAKPRRGRS